METSSDEVSDDGFGIDNTNPWMVQTARYRMRRGTLSAREGRELQLNSLMGFRRTEPLAVTTNRPKTARAVGPGRRFKPSPPPQAAPKGRELHHGQDDAAAHSRAATIREMRDFNREKYGPNRESGSGTPRSSNTLGESEGGVAASGTGSVAAGAHRPHAKDEKWRTVRLARRAAAKSDDLFHRKIAVNRARIFEGAGDLDAAIRAIDDCLSKNCTISNVKRAKLRSLRSALLAMKAQTIGHRQRFHQLAPDQRKNVWNLCREALMEANFAIQMGGENPQSLHRRAQAETALGQHVDAAWTVRSLGCFLFCIMRDENVSMTCPIQSAGAKRFAADAG
eukprot:SAG31_NODE_3064_length_4732_cov_4.692833_4_plen_337_part_00